MATHNVGGHNVTSVLRGTDHAVALPAQPKFMPVQGPANYQGTNSKPGGGLPGGRGGRGVAQSPKAQTPTTRIVPLKASN